MTKKPMLIIVPTRGRPQNVVALEASLKETDTLNAEFLYAIDPDDPACAAYEALDLKNIWIMHERLRLGGTLNLLATMHASGYEAIGFMGDDHRPRTTGWDDKIMDEINADGPRVVYGNDLLQGANLPTAVFMSSEIILGLGYMVPPGLTHLWIDNAWMALGQALGGLVYRGDVIIEHMHPIAGKAPWDERYTEVNAPTMDVADRAAYERWLREDLDSAVERVLEYYR